MRTVALNTASVTAVSITEDIRMVFASKDVDALAEHAIAYVVGFNQVYHCMPGKWDQIFYNTVHVCYAQSKFRHIVTLIHGLIFFQVRKSLLVRNV